MSYLDDEELEATRILNGIDKAETAKEYIKLKRKANKYDSIVKNIKDKIEELENKKIYFKDNYEALNYLQIRIDHLQKLLGEVEE